MTKGTIYHITTDPDGLGSMSEEDFYNILDLLSITEVEDRMGQDAKNDLDGLKETLKTSGFDIQEKRPEISEEAKEHFAFTIHVKNADKLERAKMRYFSDRLEQVKHKIETISLKGLLEDFTSNTHLTYELSRYINDGCGDVVYLGKGAGTRTYTMDHFVRELEPGQIYCVSATTVRMY